jgi:hypothetical protein
LRLAPPRLDRIVRGRAWIPVLGALLVAIVGLRVEVLKLGSGVGAQVQQATLLESDNSVLRSQISALSDNHRIITLAEGYGMYMPAPLDVHLVSAAAGTHVGPAARNISAPSRTTFLGGLATEQQDSGQGAQTVSSTTTSTSGGATTDSTVNTASGGSVSGITDTAVAPTTSDTSNATTSDATTSSPDTSASTTDATNSAATDATSSSTTAGGSGSVSTGLPDTTAPPSTSATTDSADSATGSTTGGTGLAG